MIARLVRTGHAEPGAFCYGRVMSKRRRKFDRHAQRWSYGARRRRPSQMVQIDHMSVAIDAGFRIKDSESVCPVSELCYSRAIATGRYEFHQSCVGEPGVGALNVELARFERFCNAYRPHQALGPLAPMQAHDQNFDQSALAA